MDDAVFEESFSEDGVAVFIHILLKYNNSRFITCIDAAQHQILPPRCHIRLITKTNNQKMTRPFFHSVILIVSSDLIKTKIPAPRLQDTGRRVAGLDPVAPRYIRDTHIVDFQGPFPGLGYGADRSFQPRQEQQEKRPGLQPWPGPTWTRQARHLGQKQNSEDAARPAHRTTSAFRF